MSHDLFDKVISFENLFFAAKTALLGKRRKTAPAEFYLNRSKYLTELHALLRSGAYRPGHYKTFSMPSFSASFSP